MRPPSPAAHKAINSLFYIHYVLTTMMDGEVMDSDADDESPGRNFSFWPTV